VRPDSRLVRFGLVGILNTAIDLGVYLGLRALGMALLPANSLSTSAGLLFSFLANRTFTFGDRTSSGRARVAGLFLLTTGLGLWVLQPLVIAGGEHLLATWDTADRLPGFAVHSLLPKLAGISVGIVWNYLAYDRIVFAESARAARVVGPTLMDHRMDAVDRVSTSDAA
jgi:putative flippase GtrA